MAGRDGAHRVAVGGGRGACRTQGQKIVGPHKVLCRLLHGLCIQPPGDAGVILLVKGRVDGVVVDAVQIRLSVGRIAGVEIVGHHFGTQHPDIRGQVLVQSQRQFFRRDAGVGVEIQGKAQGMDACIGAAAALDVRAAVKHRFQPILKSLGHAAPVGLHLKAAVVGAVVGQSK